MWVTCRLWRQADDLVGFALGQNDGQEDQGAAQGLDGAQGLVQQDPARQDGEDRLQTHDEGGRGRGQVLLAQNLQGKGHAGAEDTGVDQGEGAVDDTRWASP